MELKCPAIMSTPRCLMLAPRLPCAGATRQNSGLHDGSMAPLQLILPPTFFGCLDSRSYRWPKLLWRTSGCRGCIESPPRSSYANSPPFGSKCKASISPTKRTKFIGNSPPQLNIALYRRTNCSFLDPSRLSTSTNLEIKGAA